MTDAEQQRFNALFAMFESTGWSYFIEAMMADLEMLDNVMAIKDGDDALFRKGLVTALRNLEAYEVKIQNEFKIANGDFDE